MPANVSLGSARRVAKPGDTVIWEIQVTNTGEVADRFSLKVDGEFGEWSMATPSSLYLEPGATGTVRLSCKPPKESSTGAGERTLSVVARGVRDTDGPATASGPVEIEGFQALDADLDPTSVTDAKASSHRLVVSNRGTIPLHVRVSAEPGNSGLDVKIDPENLDVAPGREGTAAVTATAGTPNRGSKPASLRFGLLVEPQEGNPRRVSATLVQPGRSRRPWIIGAVAAVVVLIVVLVFTVFTGGGGKPSAVLTNLEKCPGIGHLAQMANGITRPNVVEPDNYSFLFENNNCTPVRWNPCQPIHYVVDAQFATPANLADLATAIGMVAKATGDKFVSDGDVSGEAGLVPVDAAARAAGLFPPISISWAHEGAGTSLTEVLGGGEPIVVDGVNVSGIVSFNADGQYPLNTPIPNGFTQSVSWGRVILHELGHVMGLGHVTDPNQVMHEPISDPRTTPTGLYGDGDLEGLRLLGASAGCITEPPLSALTQRVPGVPGGNGNNGP